MIREGVKMLLRLYDTKHFPCSSLCSKLYSSVSCHYMKYSFSLSFCLDSCPTFTHSFLIPPWPFTMQYSFISGQGPEKKVHHRQGKNVISSLCNTGLCILFQLYYSLAVELVVFHYPKRLIMVWKKAQKKTSLFGSSSSQKYWCTIPIPPGYTRYHLRE